MAEFRRTFDCTLDNQPAESFDKWVRSEVLSGKCRTDDAFFLDRKLIYTLQKEAVDGPPSEEEIFSDYATAVSAFFLYPADLESRLDPEMYLLHRDGSVTIPSWLT